MNELTAKNRFSDTDQTANVMAGYFGFSLLGYRKRNPLVSILKASPPLNKNIRIASLHRGPRWTECRCVAKIYHR